MKVSIFIDDRWHELCLVPPRGDGWALVTWSAITGSVNAYFFESEQQAFDFSVDVLKWSCFVRCAIIEVK